MIDNILTFLELDLTDTATTLIPILIALAASLLMGIIIHFVYRKAYTGVVFSQSFAVSLAGMTVLTTMVTLSISSNIALSLGMVGALSIVRYRVAVKDPMDILFMFWAIASGITIGAKLHYLAVITAIIVGVILLLLNQKDPFSTVYIMVVHYTGEDIAGEIKRILGGRRYKVKSKTVRNDSAEMAIELSVKNENLAFLDAINQLEAVHDATLIQYSGEYLQ
jgi:hypothetical protein